MKIAKTLDGYVVRVPDDVVAALGLKDGDAVDLRSSALATSVGPSQHHAAKSVFEHLARPLPAGFRFDREQANAR